MLELCYHKSFIGSQHTRTHSCKQAHKQVTQGAVSVVWGGESRVDAGALRSLASLTRADHASDATVTTVMGTLPVAAEEEGAWGLVGGSVDGLVCVWRLARHPSAEDAASDRYVRYS